MLFKKPYRNVVGLSQAKLEELLKNFEKLKDYGGDLYDRVVRYSCSTVKMTQCWASWPGRRMRRET